MQIQKLTLSHKIIIIDFIIYNIANKLKIVHIVNLTVHNLDLKINKKNFGRKYKTYFRIVL